MTKFQVTDDHGAGYDRDVDAPDAKQAAQEWASITFADRDYSREATCIVTAPSGEVTRWFIETDTMPVFMAAQVKA